MESMAEAFNMNLLSEVMEVLPRERHGSNPMMVLFHLSPKVSSLKCHAGGDPRRA